MSVAAGGKPVRKFPPPCWTRDEALVLISAYRERWYGLHRAFLRTTDWDAVAEKVTTSCPDVTPPKTSAQCRHKMEKLRQRHRAEKQRASAFSGDRFFSSWFYFEAMEAMENGSNPINPQIIRFKPSSVQNLVTLATRNKSPNLSPRVSKRQETLIREAKNSSSRPGLRPRRFIKIDNVKIKKKKKNGGIWEMVSSIKLLGDGFMRMEKMKMEMAKEIEKMRMETEMKRNELIMESHKQIMDAFVKALMPNL